MSAITTLTLVDVSENNLKDSGKAFGEVPKTSLCLRELKMQDCNLDSEDVRDLVGGIAVSNTLWRVDVRKNFELGEERRVALNQALRTLRAAQRPGVELLM